MIQHITTTVVEVKICIMFGEVVLDALINFKSDQQVT